MAHRKPTPNIMGELLGEKTEPAPNKNKLSNQQAGKTVKQQNNIPVQQQTGTGKAVKATYYFSPGTIEAIDEAWMKLRRLAGVNRRSSISKSLIVEKAVAMALQEFERKGEKSQLASMTVSQQK